MAKKLVIVESPAKAKTINKYLGSDFSVKASMGHVRDLPERKFGVEIEKKFKPTYQVSAKRKTLVTELQKSAEGAEQVYLATDPDREGEAIAWHLWEILKSKKNGPKFFRVQFNEITKNAVRAAFDNPGQVDMKLVDSQQARRILDRIVGYKISPLIEQARCPRFERPGACSPSPCGWWWSVSVRFAHSNHRSIGRLRLNYASWWIRRITSSRG